MTKKQVLKLIKLDDLDYCNSLLFVLHILNQHQNQSSSYIRKYLLPFTVKSQGQTYSSQYFKFQKGCSLHTTHVYV